MNTVTLTNDERRWRVQSDLDLYDSPELAQRIVEYMEDHSPEEKIREDLSTELERMLDEPLNELNRLIQDVEDETVEGDLETLQEIYNSLVRIPDSVLD